MKLRPTVSVSVLVALLAVSFVLMDQWRPPLRAAFFSLYPRAPLHPEVGRIPELSSAELQGMFAGKRALVVGGTRGVGRGLSLALSSAGASVTVVGRNPRHGEQVVSLLQQRRQREDQAFRFLQGDLMTASSAHSLGNILAAHARDHDPFDVLVQTAAVFPDWEGEALQADGIEKCFAVAVVGRFILYSRMNEFMRASSTSPLVVMNVMTGGDKPLASFHRDIVTGRRVSSSLVETMLCTSLGNDLMQLAMEGHAEDLANIDLSQYTRVSTHPGLLMTDLHRGQGVLFDVLEWLGVFLIGFTEEEAGLRQSSILAAALTGQIPQGQLTYVDSELWGREKSHELLEEYENHHEWLWQRILFPVLAAVKA